jgi:MFS family permease
LKKRLPTLSLFIANLSTYIPQLLTSLLFIEIGLTFDIEVGVAGQIGTAASTLSTIVVLLMGFLSVKYRYESLLLVGLVILCLSTLGSSLAPSFGILLAVYALTGVSGAMVLPTSQALIGGLFTVEERPTVIGYITVAGATAYAVGLLSAGYIGDWRLAFAFCALPIALCSLLFAKFGIPTTSSRGGKTNYVQGFKVV